MIPGGGTKIPHDLWLKNQTQYKSNIVTNSIKTLKMAHRGTKKFRTRKYLLLPLQSPSPRSKSPSPWSWLTHICTRQREGSGPRSLLPAPGIRRPHPALAHSALSGSYSISS